MKLESRSVTPRAEVMSTGIDQKPGSFILRQVLKRWLPGVSDGPLTSPREREPALEFPRVPAKARD